MLLNENNVAKYNLGQVRLELMQSAVFPPPCAVRDLRGGPLRNLRGFCVALSFLLQCCLLIFADLLRSICESLRILAPSPTPPLGCWCLGKYGSGKLFPLIIQFDGAC